MLACFSSTYSSLRLNRVETSFRTILKSVFTTMKLTNETVEDLLEIIPQRCATKQLQIIAHVAMPARKHITASKIFTTPKNTKESFAKNFQIDQILVTMEICVPSLTQKLNCRLMCLKKWTKIQISICSILKLYGVPSVTNIISENNAFMHTIGKISGASQLNINIQMTNVSNGTQKRIFRRIQMDVNQNIAVEIATAGKNKNTILAISKWVSVVSMLMASVKRCIAHIITTKMNVENLYTKTLS